MRTVTITRANVNGGQMLEAVLPASPGEVYAGLPYASVANEHAIQAVGCDVARRRKPVPRRVRAHRA